MKAIRILVSGLALALSSCAVPGGLPAPLPPLPGVLRPVTPFQPPPLPAPTGYLPDEYHSGYDIGSRDASYGYPPESARAYERFGHGSEATFNEGYADGYERRGARR